jgi:hypothetical protein
MNFLKVISIEKEAYNKTREYLWLPCFFYKKMIELYNENNVYLSLIL